MTFSSFLILFPLIFLPILQRQDLHCRGGKSPCLDVTLSMMCVLGRHALVDTLHWVKEAVFCIDFLLQHNNTRHAVVHSDGMPLVPQFPWVSFAGRCAQSPTWAGQAAIPSGGSRRVALFSKLIEIVDRIHLLAARPRAPASYGLLAAPWLPATGPSPWAARSLSARFFPVSRRWRLL